MSVLRIKLTHNAAEIARHLAAFPPEMLQAVARAMDKQNNETIGYANAHKMSGPRPKLLGRVSSDLAGSLRASRPIVSGHTVTSAIGSHMVYAAVHEFGINAVVQVKAHSRQIVKTSEKTTARLDARGRIRRSRNIVKTQTGVAQVSAHKRTMSMPERSYIRSSVTENEPKYAEAISDAIVAAWKGATH